MATGQEIRNRLEEWGLVHILGTAVGTSTTSYLSDTTRLQTLGLASSSFDGAFVRMGGSNTLSGVQVRVDYLDQANGRLNVTPVWSEAPTEGDPSEVWAHGIDPDDDNDNILDVDEIGGMWGWYRYDHDNDGIWDMTDLDDDNDGLSDWFEQNDGNPLTGQFDHDNDGIPDYFDDDDDGDGIPDDLEN